MSEYPVPHHLKNIFSVTRFKGNALDGKIVCECGCENFRVLYFGSEYKSGHIGCLKYKNNFALNVTGICVSCGKRHLLFDLAKHGFENFAEDFTDDEKLSPEDYVDAFNWLVINLKCSECGKNFQGFVNIELS